ncbi:hypothetical protein FKR81_11180 [Lentzea tibetensis]|uniref:Uncharacterized protein n=1 Tax=Lentzea tibetensis TaxID=2591470 RepID=A0A563EWP2_9PSEU|nr:hypothetical protein [Lentzea tibetensis]TWP52137.1 hypothetical protein FKR81_11180 [Lentzea tibetensis]
MTGFGAVPEELRAAAKKIGDTVGQATDCGWNGPSGDYGHPGVASSWDEFIRDLRKHVDFLKGKAEEFGTGLVDAARVYVETDTASTADFGKAGQGLDQGPPLGIMNPDVARRLNPDWSPPRDFPSGPNGPVY